MANLRQHPTVKQWYGERAMKNVRDHYDGIADLRAHPNVNQWYAERAMKNVRDHYKGIDQGLGDTPTEIHIGNRRGPGFSETYTVGQTDPTQKGKVNPDAMRIELRKARQHATPLGDADMLRTILAAESTHQLTQTDPVVRGIKMKLIESLKEGSEPWHEMHRRYEQTVNDGATGTNWESYESALNGPMGDWLLFERVFPELNEPHWREYYEKGGGFDPKQMELLNELKRYLKEGSQNVNQR